MAFFPSGSVDSRIDTLFFANGTYSITNQGINKANSGGAYVTVNIPLGKAVPSGKTVTVNSVTIGELYRYDADGQNLASGATGSATFSANSPSNIIVKATKAIEANKLYYVGATVNFTVS